MKGSPPLKSFLTVSIFDSILADELLMHALRRLAQNPFLIRWLRRTRLLSLAYDLREIGIAVQYGWKQKLNPFKDIKTDGAPIPSLLSMVKVAGHGDVNRFKVRGFEGAYLIQEVLAKHGVALEQLHTALDFGCGVGRIIRHLPSFAPLELYGSDYNPTLVDWCARNLPFAHFQTNPLAPPLAYPDGKFDLVYAFSVFTHFDETLHRQWIDELTRVLKPGGYLLISVMGEATARRLLFTEAEWARFHAGELVVRYAEAAGMNLTGAFCSVDYIRQNLCHTLELVDHIPEGAIANGNQDVVLLRKPS
jgi:hypothetical protein